MFQFPDQVIHFLLHGVNVLPGGEDHPLKHFRVVLLRGHFLCEVRVEPEVADAFFPASCFTAGVGRPINHLGNIHNKQLKLST